VIKTIFFIFYLSFLKYQIKSTKFQISSNDQIQNSKLWTVEFVFLFLRLEFGNWDLFVIWNLERGIFHNIILDFEI